MSKEDLAKFDVHKGDTQCISEAPDSIQLAPYEQDFTDQMKAMKQIMEENRDVLKRLAE